MRASLPLFLTLSLGCSTSLSTMQPVQALPKGDLQFGTSVGFNVAPGPIIDALDAGAAVLKKDQVDINAQDEQDLLTAGLAIMLNPPSVLNEYSFRYGLGHNWDAGMRYTGNSILAEGKWQFLDNEDPSMLDGAIHLGVGRHIIDGFIVDTLDKFDLASFSRTDASISAMIGKKPNDFFEFWVGPKYVAGFYSEEGVFVDTGAVANSSGVMQYIGGTAGLSLGWKYVYFTGELTVADLLFKADILGAERDLGGVVVFPAVGLSIRVPTKKMLSAQPL